MARLPRLYARDTPQLVQARFARPLANAHEPTPAAALNRLHEWLAVEVRRHDVAIHCWAIGADRIQLLATPSSPEGLPKVVQGIGRRMAAGLVHGRVFEGRYRSTLVEDEWVLACMTWIESLPLRQQLVDTAERWPWSSASEHMGLRSDDGMLADHPRYWSMGNTPFARQARYRSHLQAGSSRDESVRIEKALIGQWALGSDEFIAWIGPRCTRRAAPAPRGRPRNSPAHNIVTN